MFCSQCGEEIRAGAKFCSGCGAPAPQDPTRVPAPGAAKDALRSVVNQAKQTVSSFQSAAPKAQQNPPAYPTGVQDPQQTTYAYQTSTPQVQPAVAGQQGMAWFKFIIYVQLWASVLVFVAAGITLLTGAHYGSSSSLVYGLIPSLHVLDILFGLSVLGLAVFCIYVRFALARYRQKGPKLYLWVYVLSIIIPLIYLVVLLAVLSGYSSLSASYLLQNTNTTELIVYMIFDVIMIIVNKIYFDKRKHLFVN